MVEVVFWFGREEEAAGEALFDAAPVEGNGGALPDAEFDGAGGFEKDASVLLALEGAGALVAVVWFVERAPPPAAGVLLREWRCLVVVIASFSLSLEVTADWDGPMPADVEPMRLGRLLDALVLAFRSSPPLPLSLVGWEVFWSSFSAALLLLVEFIAACKN